MSLTPIALVALSIPCGSSTSALFLTVGDCFMTVDSRLSELSFIRPFKYNCMLIVLIYFYLIWGNKPTIIMIGGTTIIVISGIILVPTEKRRNHTKILAPQGQ